MQPKVSIVIPVFNGMPYIQAAVQSSLNQDYENIEVIVVDNASQDGTRQWLQTLKDSKITVIYRDELQSASANWTQATDLATGTYTKLLCADDLLDPDIVQTQVGLLEANPAAVMAASKRRIIDSQGKVVRKAHGLAGLQQLESGSETLKKCFQSGTNLLGEPASVLFRTESIKQVMPWHSQWPYVTDIATYAFVLRQGGLVIDPQVRASFRIAPTSWSASLVGEQEEQFSKWQASEIATKFVSLNAIEKFQSFVYLKAKTFARKLFFAREGRKSR